MQLAVGPRKRSAAGQALKIALCLQSDCLPLGEGILLLPSIAAAQGFDQGNVGAQPLGLNVQQQQLLGEDRPAGFFGGVAAEEAALIMSASAIGGGLRRGDF